MKNDSLAVIEERLRCIILSLKNNPLFRMSLGSKELFHSNFLEYLWNLDKPAFIKMINSLPSSMGQFGKMLDEKVSEQYSLEREKKNFDICIYHKVNEKVVYDLILENKVKSIPYKEQLRSYEKKAEKSQNCRFILLTLSKDFPDKEDKEIEKWDIVGYEDLYLQIELFYKKERNNSDPNYYYINDYLSFVEKLCKLKDYTLPDQDQVLLSQHLFDDTVIDALKMIRLHDLYIKLRCSWFAMILKNHFKEKAKVVHAFNDIEDSYVNLNVAINQGNGQIAAWICNKDADRDLKGKKQDLRNTFEIVIQGNQYRHGINQARFLLDIEDKYERLNQQYLRLATLQDKRPYDFLNFRNEWVANSDLRPYKENVFQKTEIEKRGPFNCYGESYIYRYTEITNSDTIGTLLEQMRRDINKVLNNPPSLE